MDIPSAADEAEPGAAKTLFQSSVVLLLLIFLLDSCQRKEEALFLSRQGLAGKKISAREIRLPVKKVLQRKKIYLTFDDGPNKGTLNVFNAVKEDSIPASFFIVGKHVYDSPQQEVIFEQLKADSTIELCNHSYTHALNHYTRFYQQPGEVVKDIEKNANEIGFNNAVVRMPGRNAWRIDTVSHTDIKESEAAIDSVHHAGFAVMGWDVEWMFDHKDLSLTTDTDQLLRQIENMLASQKTKTAGHLVLLAHDQAFQTPESLEKLHYLFRQLKNNPEYELALAGTYPGIKNKTPQSSVNP
ncbi:MAG: polysaccharide deacetylase family protein [Chitinophagaceae bacterium]